MRLLVADERPSASYVSSQQFQCRALRHSRRFAWNWELSTARGTQIIQLFIAKYALAPNRLSACGHGEYYPRFTHMLRQSD